MRFSLSLNHLKVKLMLFKLISTSLQYLNVKGIFKNVHMLAYFFTAKTAISNKTVKLKEMSYWVPKNVYNH